MDLSKTSLGLWGDNPRKEILTEEFFEILRDEMKFDLLAVMIDRHDKDPTFQYKPKHVEQLLKLADPGSIEIVLTTWPYPDKKQIDKQCSQMRTLMKVGPVAGWEVDLEFNWKPHLVQGFHNLDEAGDYLVEKTKEIVQIQDARFEMTSFTQHVENSSRADVGPEADRLLVQAYSVNYRNNKMIGFNDMFGPGRMQKFTLDRTMTIPGIKTEKGPRLGVGLAAWRQRFAGYNPSEAMRVALQTTLMYQPIDIRWWSSKHIISIDPKRRRANPYALDFLKTLRPD